MLREKDGQKGPHGVLIWGPLRTSYASVKDFRTSIAGVPPSYKIDSCLPMPHGRHRASFEGISKFDRERIVAYRDCELSFERNRSTC
ncbi:hypothetical protein TNCV_2229671 [Trichonephila clavipes]|uniref:Uncharacterized protein n=1 Tax=Trichonephila clavipes TaxID=2585209 RepID=A0A8X7BIH7_TRICX|nr:hypothetical protein TNCV_2229671 [Trichonephila clavipes]